MVVLPDRIDYQKEEVMPGLPVTPVAVELIEGARLLPEYTYPDRAIYIFGPEDGSSARTYWSGVRT